MNQKADYPDPLKVTISPEAFEAWEEDHVLSGRYRKNKRKMLRKYRCGLWEPEKGRRVGFPATRAALVLLASGTIALAADSEFFGRYGGRMERRGLNPMRRSCMMREQTHPLSSPGPGGNTPMRIRTDHRS